MAILTYPDVTPSSVSWKLTSNTQKFTSPFSKASQTVGLSGALWGGTINYAIMNETMFNTMNAFLVQLRGMGGRFYYSPKQYFADLATGLTATTSDSISVALSSPVTDLVVGNYISINNELKMIVIKTDDSNYKVEPPFRELYTAQPIELNDPTCIMMLASDDFVMNFKPPVLENTSFDIVEAISV